jgi:urease accessory protein
MLKVMEILSAAAAADPADDTLTLPFELRQKSRLVARSDQGRELALQLPRGHVLRHGARLAAEDGSVIAIRAAGEELSVVESADPAALARAAYHLGNRHVALQIEAGALSYLHDHVLDDMVRGLGLAPRTIEQRFEPEPGAYGRGHGLGHHHGPEDGHDHEH